MKLNKDIVAFIKEKTFGCYKEDQLLLEKLCKKLNLKCLSAEYPREISGAIIKDDDGDGYTIYVNKDHARRRQRFTIAHEVGHYISYLYDSHSKQKLLDNKGFEDKLIF